MCRYSGAPTQWSREEGNPVIALKKHSITLYTAAIVLVLRKTRPGLGQQTCNGICIRRERPVAVLADTTRKPRARFQGALKVISSHPRGLGLEKRTCASETDAYSAECISEQTPDFWILKGEYPSIYLDREQAQLKCRVYHVLDLLWPKWTHLCTPLDVVWRRTATQAGSCPESRNCSSTSAI